MHIPEESKTYSGYYITDVYPEILISKTGEIISAIDGQVKKQYNEGGYRTVYTYCGERKRYRCVKVHRAVAHTFYGHPPPNYPMVNHRDGVRYNNHYSNVEWSNAAHNRRHAVDNEFIQPTGKPIWVWDILSNKKTRYVSISECARVLNAPHPTVASWPYNKNNDVFLGKYVVRYENKLGEVTWPKIEGLDKQLAKNKCNGVIALDIATGVNIIAKSVTHMAEHLNISVRSVAAYMRRENIHVMHGHIFRWLKDAHLPWPSLETAKMMVEERDKRIKAMDIKTKEVVVGADRKSICVTLGVSGNIIKKRLVMHDDRPVNGFIFRRYRDNRPWPN